MIQNAIGIQTLREQLNQEIKRLPFKKISEVIDFISYLNYRDNLKAANQPVVLEGLWEGIVFDVTDEDVRRLRQQSSLHTKDKINALFS